MKVDFYSELNSFRFTVYEKKRKEIINEIHSLDKISRKLPIVAVYQKGELYNRMVDIVSVSVKKKILSRIIKKRRPDSNKK